MLYVFLPRFSGGGMFRQIRRFGRRVLKVSFCKNIYIAKSRDRADEKPNDRPISRPEMPVDHSANKETQKDRNQHIDPKLGDHTQQSYRLPFFLLLFGFSLLRDIQPLFLTLLQGTRNPQY